METSNKQQCLAYLGLCMEGDALEWWKANMHRYTTLEEVKDASREYYGNYNKLERAFNKISNLKQTDTVQKYLNDIHRLNFHV